MRPFPAEPMRMWPTSTRVNKPENDDPSILKPIEPSARVADRTPAVKSAARSSLRALRLLRRCAWPMLYVPGMID